ncbi:hypothetical protein D3C72_1929040 [compost metagenome]
MFVQLAIQRCPAYTQRLGGLADISLNFQQRRGDGGTFECTQFTWDIDGQRGR